LFEPPPITTLPFGCKMAARLSAGTITVAKLKDALPSVSKLVSRSPEGSSVDAASGNANKSKPAQSARAKLNTFFIRLPYKSKRPSPRPRIEVQILPPDQPANTTIFLNGIVAGSPVIAM